MLSDGANRCHRHITRPHSRAFQIEERIFVASVAIDAQQDGARAAALRLRKALKGRFRYAATKAGTAIRQTSSGEKRGVPFSGRDRSMMSGCSAIGAESSPAARFTPPVGLKMS